MPSTFCRSFRARVDLSSPAAAKTAQARPPQKFARRLLAPRRHQWQRRCQTTAARGGGRNLRQLPCWAAALTLQERPLLPWACSLTLLPTRQDSTLPALRRAPPATQPVAAAQPQHRAPNQRQRQHHPHGLTSPSPLIITPSLPSHALSQLVFILLHIHRGRRRQAHVIVQGWRRGILAHQRCASA